MKPLFSLSAHSFNLSPKTTLQPLLGSLLNVFIYFCFMFCNLILQIGPLTVHERSHVSKMPSRCCITGERGHSHVAADSRRRHVLRPAILLLILGTLDTVRLLEGRRTRGKKPQRHFLSAHLPGSR